MIGLYSVVWGKSKDMKSTSDDMVKGEGQELPIKGDTRSLGSDIFDKIEVSVPAEKSKGAGMMNHNVPPTVPPPRL